MKPFAVVLLVSLLLAACSSSDPDASSSSSTVAATTAPATVTKPPGNADPKSECSDADLTAPSMPMPTPTVVKAPVVIEPRYQARLVPAEEGPRIDGAAAWQALLKVNPMRARSGDLLFGTFRATIPYGARGPQKFNIHAWVLRVKHLAYVYPTSRSGAVAGSPTKRPVCIFTDGYFVIDSNDGANVLNSF